MSISDLAPAEVTTSPHSLGFHGYYYDNSCGYLITRVYNGWLYERLDDNGAVITTTLVPAPLT